MKLNTHCVTPELMEILNALNGMEFLKDAALGGGTSLALLYGHRKSIDIDFFFRHPFDSVLLQESLAQHFSNYTIVNRTPGSLSGMIGSVKCDILLHSYPLLNEYNHVENLRLISLQDMAAMKVNAVTNRGSKKDFSDLLLLHETGLLLPDALDFFCAKYGSAGRFLAIKSLNWFDDAEAEPDPVYLNGWTWKQVRRHMADLAQALLK